jgi:hypothetical protein
VVGTVLAGVCGTSLEVVTGETVATRGATTARRADVDGFTIGAGVELATAATFSITTGCVGDAE